MSKEPPSITYQCASCEREFTKVHRKHKGKKYCAACYKRLFKRGICPGCRNFARLFIGNSGEVCYQCERSKPCVRCGKTNYRVGLMTEYGPACASCAPYFKDSETCPQCGKQSKRLSKYIHIPGDLRVCPKCGRSNHKTCPKCGRYRKLQPTPDGQMLCKPCAEIGIKRCRDCGKEMPAGYGNRCEECYWNSLLDRKLQNFSAGFSNELIAANFEDFIEWLKGRSGSQYANNKIRHYFRFFQEVDSEWTKIPEYEQLLEHLGADKIRKHRLFLTWAKNALGMRINLESKKADSEGRMIERIVDQLKKGSYEYIVLHGYYQNMLDQQKTKPLTLKSIRGNLTPANELLSRRLKMKTPNFTQKLVDDFFRDKPGQRSATSGFISYLNTNWDTKLQLPSKEQVAKWKRAKMKKRLVELYRKKQLDQSGLAEWIKVSMCYFHGFSSRKASSLNIESFHEKNDGFETTLAGEVYWVPDPENKRIFD